MKKLFVFLLFLIFLSGCGLQKENQTNSSPKSIVDSFIQNEYRPSVEQSGDTFVEGLSSTYKESGNQAVVVSLVCVDYKDKMINTFTGPPLITVLEKSDQDWIIQEEPIDIIPENLRNERSLISAFGQKIRKQLPKDCLRNSFG